MRRAECKGRTLCLKVKLHTFEVLTRQIVPPKAVYLADDLYNYSLPMLAKLEQEIPGMRLRLMGLRCTHLVSTKKPDTRSFFGLRPQKTESATLADETNNPEGSRECAERESEEWLEKDASPGPDKEPDMASPQRRHGKEIVPNPTRDGPAEPHEELWDCPICARPQPADERLFNDHIDLCLSRQTIRDTVQQDAAEQQQLGRGVPETKKPREKKRARGPVSADPRQKKLCFG
jgi:DNA polymerase kappa